MVQRALERILYIWALRHPASGYVQVAAPPRHQHAPVRGCCLVPARSPALLTTHRRRRHRRRQGINDLVTPFFMAFLSSHLPPDRPHSREDVDQVEPHVLAEVEADSYWCLSKLIDSIQDHYTFAQPGIQRMVFKLKELVARIDPKHPLVKASVEQPAGLAPLNLKAETLFPTKSGFVSPSAAKKNGKKSTGKALAKIKPPVEVD